MPIYSSDSSDSDNQSSSHVRLFGRQRPLHDILGKGIVADVLLWRNKYLSAATFIVFTLMWFLFEVVEYPFLTLLCHIFITTMLIVFIWSNGAPLFDRTPPKIPEIILSKSAVEESALIFHKKFSRFLGMLFDIAYGKDLKFFLVAITSLWILSVIGNYLSTLNLLYLGFLCIGTLPALYDQYEREVDDLANKGNRDIKKLYKKFDSKVLNKIPRRPVKEKRFR